MSTQLFTKGHCCNWESPIDKLGIPSVALPTLESNPLLPEDAKLISLPETKAVITSFIKLIVDGLALFGADTNDLKFATFGPFKIKDDTVPFILIYTHLDQRYALSTFGMPDWKGAGVERFHQGRAAMGLYQRQGEQWAPTVFMDEMALHEMAAHAVTAFNEQFQAPLRWGRRPGVTFNQFTATSELPAGSYVMSMMNSYMPILPQTLQGHSPIGSQKNISVSFSEFVQSVAEVALVSLHQTASKERECVLQATAKLSSPFGTYEHPMEIKLSLTPVGELRYGLTAL